jgi:hypothetical protein
MLPVIDIMGVLHFRSLSGELPGTARKPRESRHTLLQAVQISEFTGFHRFLAVLIGFQAYSSNRQGVRTLAGH